MTDDAVLDEPQFVEVGGDKRRIALRSNHADGAGTGLFWLNGFHSVMSGGKATHLAGWAAERGLDYTRFDYSGHGLSGGPAFEGTLSDWLEEAAAVYRATARTQQILVGSSMGGWLALRLAQRINTGAPFYDKPIKGIVLIAPAWDMTERLVWARLPDADRATLMREGVWHRPSRYDDGPYPISRDLIEDGQTHCLASYEGRCNGVGRVDLSNQPVRIIHGRNDPDVPWEGSVALMDLIIGEDVRLSLIKDGEHRLSRPQDLSVLETLIADCL